MKSIPGLLPSLILAASKVSDEELDLIFAAFDTTGDGAIDSKEYGKLVTESAASLNTQGGGNGVSKSQQ